MIQLEKGHDRKVVLFFARTEEKYPMDGRCYLVFGRKGYKINGDDHPGVLINPFF